VLTIELYNKLRQVSVNSASGGIGAAGLLVPQLQMLNMFGCIGGSNASNEFKSFSEGFGELKYE